MVEHANMKSMCCLDLWREQWWFFTLRELFWGCELILIWPCNYRRGASVMHIVSVIPFMIFDHLWVYRCAWDYFIVSCLRRLWGHKRVLVYMWLIWESDRKLGLLLIFKMEFGRRREGPAVSLNNQTKFGTDQKHPLIKCFSLLIR